MTKQRKRGLSAQYSFFLILFRPALLSRHLALASQTNSLTSFLALANPNIYNAQISHFNEALTLEALEHNKFSSSDNPNGNAGGTSQSSLSNDVLFSGSKDAVEEDKSGSNLVKVQYTDEKNPLRKLAPHPFFPLESEKGQLVLPPLLLPRPDENVIIEEQERWKSWANLNNIPELGKLSKGDDTLDEIHWIELVREQIKDHDKFAGQAIRSFIHAKEATDEMGQKYDWKMRLDMDEISDDEEDERGKDEDDLFEEENRKRKREAEGGSDEATLTLQQVASFFNTGDL